MTLARFQLYIQFSKARPSNISVARWNAMIRFVQTKIK